jgi:polyhydroxyalkanoate synthesis regulator phasin
MKYLKKFFEVVKHREELYPKREIEHKNMIEPALLTYKEYFDTLQKGAMSEWHDEGTYLYSIEDGEPWYYNDINDGTWQRIKNQKINNLNIEYYKKEIKIGQKGRQYSKTDKEGNIIRDEKGMAIPADETDYEKMRQELKKQGKIESEIHFIAYHRDENLIIGSVQDEWGCVLISVLKEYQGNGIGETLIDLYRHYYPYKPTGGVTSQGESSLRRFHTRQVKKYLQNGIYSDLVKKGEITAERAKEIINSITKETKQKTGSELSKIYGGTGKLMYYLTDNTVIIFDMSVKEIMDKRENFSDRFLKKLIKCYIYLSSFQSKDFDYLNLWTVYAENEKFLKIGIDILLSSGEKISDYYLDKNFDEKTKTMIKNVFNSSNFNIKQEKGFLIGQTCNVISEKNKKFNFEELKTDSQNWFKVNDKFGEFEDNLLEFTDVITRNE